MVRKKTRKYALPRAEKQLEPALNKHKYLFNCLPKIYLANQ